MSTDFENLEVLIEHEARDVGIAKFILFEDFTLVEPLAVRDRAIATLALVNSALIANLTIPKDFNFRDF